MGKDVEQAVWPNLRQHHSLCLEELSKKHERIQIRITRLWVEV
jgi:hypothetical protein